MAPSGVAASPSSLGFTRKAIALLLLICVTISVYIQYQTTSTFFLSSLRDNGVDFETDQAVDTSSANEDYKAAIAKSQKGNDGDEEDRKDKNNDENTDADSVDSDDEVQAAEETSRDGETENKDANESETTKDRKRMNVVVLFPDDWRYNSIGKENPIIKTPFLDTLADQGIHFRQNAVTTSICWQSRATLFSGQWASRHRSYKLKCPHFARPDKWNATWPALLQQDGYHVGHVGKWQYHNDNTGRFDYQSFFEGRHWYDKKPTITGDEKARNETIKFLKTRPKEKPFAVTVAFYPPKPVGNGQEPGEQWKPRAETRALYDNVTIPEPYNHTEAFHLLPEFIQEYRSAATDRWRRRYSSPKHYQEAMKNIYALITQVDQACKEIVDELKKQGLFNNTMIIFTTDNGMFHSSHGLAGKWYPYQESIRVPLIVYDPRMPKDKVGTVDESFTLNVDLAETILGAAGLKPHESMQGRDMSDLYLPNKEDGKAALERKPWRDEFFYEFDFFQKKFIPGSKALVRKKWKLIHWHQHDQFQLFDLENDPLELKDLIKNESHNDTIAEMKKRLEEMKTELEEPDIGCNTNGNYRLTLEQEVIFFAEKEKEKLEAEKKAALAAANGTSSK